MFICAGRCLGVQVSVGRSTHLESWKRSLHLAALTTTKEDSTLWYLYGQMLRILCNHARCPQTRAALWLQHQRELSLLKFARHFQALAAHWLQAILQSACDLYRVLQRACATATRLAAKAARTRRTTAQILQEDIRCPLESGALAIAVNA